MNVWDWIRNNKSTLIDLVALIISISAFIISYKVAFSEADLEMRYILGESGKITKDYIKCDVNNSFVIQFIVRNKGYGSTVYAVQPQIDISPLPLIRYNDGKNYKEIISTAELKSIGSKSSDLVEIVIRNITEADIPDFITVIIWDYASGEHDKLVFEKPPIDYCEFLELLYSS